MSEKLGYLRENARRFHFPAQNPFPLAFEGSCRLTLFLTRTPKLKRERMRRAGRLPRGDCLEPGSLQHNNG